METYIEHINQFVVERLEDYSKQARAELRLNGIDPDENWLLTWSYETSEAAEERKKWYLDNNFSGTFRVRDLGAPMEIVRNVSAFF